MFIESSDNIWTRMAFGILDLLIPLQCLFCRKSIDSYERRVPICEHHIDELKPIETPACLYCGRSLRKYENSASENPELDEDGEQFQSVTVDHVPGEIRDQSEEICGHCRSRSLTLHFTVSGFKYEDRLKTVVADWKFDGNDRWGPWLGRKLHKQVRSRLNPLNWDMLVPVPLHKDRYSARGFNQADQLAEALSDPLNTPVKSVLSKYQRTQPQSDLSRDERLENLADAFSVETDSELTNTSVILVDDIYTTGSTLRSAARELLERGVRRVGAVTLARA